MERECVKVGMSYPKGNLEGQVGKPTWVKVTPTISYYRVSPTGERELMEHNPQTGRFEKINIPLL